MKPKKINAIIKNSTDSSFVLNEITEITKTVVVFKRA